MKAIAGFEVIVEGPENSQYWQGQGLAFTPYKVCATGIGDTPADALADALDGLAQQGYEVSDAQEKEMEKTLGTEADTSVVDALEIEADEDGEYPDDLDSYWYVTIKAK